MQCWQGSDVTEQDQAKPDLPTEGQEAHCVPLVLNLSKWPKYFRKWKNSKIPKNA